MPPARAASSLPRNLALAYALLIAYACLHPFLGWRASGLPLFDYLTAPWPKYYRVWDLLLNVLGYVPFGFLFMPALPRRIRAVSGIALATLAAATLSFGLETLQNFLPARVSSNVDLACNTVGALVGALAGARWGHALFGERGWLHRWRSERIIPGHMGDAGLILLGVWLLTQLVPDSFLFGSGDLRRVLGLATPLHFAAEDFILAEATLVALTVLGVGLSARCTMRAPSPWPVLALLVLGLGAKALAVTLFSSATDPLPWLTPGARQGLLIGVPLLLGAFRLAPLQQHALAGMALLAMIALTNVLPLNPYLLVDHGGLRQGNFLNFHGLTHLAAETWPFFALAYLAALGLWRGEHLSPR